MLKIFSFQEFKALDSTCPRFHQQLQNSWKALAKVVSEYDQEIPQSQTADKPMAPRGRATQQLRDTRKTN